MNSVAKFTSNEKKSVMNIKRKLKNSKKGSKKHSSKSCKQRSNTYSKSRKPSRIERAVMKFINHFKKDSEPEEDLTNYYLESESQPPLKLEKGASCIHRYSENQPVASLKQFSRTERWELQRLPTDDEYEINARFQYSKAKIKKSNEMNHSRIPSYATEILEQKFGNSDLDFSKMQASEKEIFRMIFLCTDVAKVDSHKRLIHTEEDEIEAKSTFWQMHWANLTLEESSEKEAVHAIEKQKGVEMFQKEGNVEFDEVKRGAQHQEEEFSDMWSAEEDSTVASGKNGDVKEETLLKSSEIQETEGKVLTTASGDQPRKEVESDSTIDCLSNLTTPYHKAGTKTETTIQKNSPSKYKYEEFDSLDSQLSSFYSLDSCCLKKYPRTSVSTYTSEPKSKSPAQSEPKNKSPIKRIDYNVFRKPKYNIEKEPEPEKKSTMFNAPPPDMRYKKRREGEVYIPAYFRLHSSIDFESALRDPLPSDGNSLRPFKCGNKCR